MLRATYSEPATWGIALGLLGGVNLASMARCAGVTPIPSNTSSRRERFSLEIVRGAER